MTVHSARTSSVSHHPPALCSLDFPSPLIDERSRGIERVSVLRLLVLLLSSCCSLLDNHSPSVDKQRVDKCEAENR